MEPRRQRQIVAVAAIGLWLLFVVCAVASPVLLDDWFQLRYWRDHELGLASLWTYAHHNYFHYNPRIGEVFLAIVDGSPVIHVIVTPLVQLATLPIVFAIAFGRWPRAVLRDLELLVFVQVMIWLIIPIPGILYFYRPFATNYLWGFTITLALFVPYRLGIAGRAWLVPVMLVAGWLAGMCNEHTGPTAIVAMAAFVGFAWRRGRLRAWMIAGMIGLYVGYPMLVFAPGQSVRYGGLATRATPTTLLAQRGLRGCAEIVGGFLYESRLALLFFGAAAVGYVVARRLRGEHVRFARAPLVAAGLLAGAALAVVMTLFVSPTTSDRVFAASGVLVVGACAIGAERLFGERGVRRFVVGACLAIGAYHVVRFVDAYVAGKAENADRIAALAAAPPGSVVLVPSYEHASRSRWYFGDDFIEHPWLADYVGRELFDLAAVEVDWPRHKTLPRGLAQPPQPHVPTYREWQRGVRVPVSTIELAGVAYPRPVFVVADGVFVDGRPYDDLRGHFVRVDRASLPAGVARFALVGCDVVYRTDPIDDGGDALLLPVDERDCRGPFTAIACTPARCWVAGWY